MKHPAVLNPALRIFATFCLLALGFASIATPLPRLKVGDNHRFLVTADGQPFSWLGDTACESFHRLTREEAEIYLKNRAERRFTVIQAVVLAELDGLKDPNPYGHTPLEKNDPTKPNEDYFKHVNWIVAKANSLANRNASGVLLTLGLRLDFEAEDIARLYGVPPEHLRLPGENQVLQINITP